MSDHNKEEVFEYLTVLRDSGVTNMMFAPSYLTEYFGMTKREAMDYFTDWCNFLRAEQ